MNAAWLAWLSPALDVAVLIGLAVTWWQLRRDPSAAWQAYEARLRELQEQLRLLVVQAEGEARDLDRRLAARAEQLEALAESAGVTGAAQPVSRAGELGPLPFAAASSERSGATSARLRATQVPAGVGAYAGGAVASVGASASAAASGTAAAATTATAARDDAAGSELSLAQRVQQLAAARTPIAEIARRLSLPVAEARVLAGLTTGGLASAARASEPSVRPGVATPAAAAVTRELGS